MAKKAIIVSHDWGAFISWKFVLQYPEFVERFVSITITHPKIFEEELRLNPLQQKASQYINIFLKPNEGEALVTKFQQNVLLNGEELSYSKEMIEIFSETWKRVGFTSGLNYYRANFVGPIQIGTNAEYNFLDLKSLHVLVPTLVIYPKDDIYVKESGLDKLHYYIDNLTIRKVANATHWICREKTDQVISILEEFFRF